MAELDVVTIGNALVDVLSGIDDTFLKRESLVKGSMNLVDQERAHLLYERMGPANQASGGSAANTATGVVACGGKAAFIGTVADDELGEIFTHDIQAAGVLYQTAPRPAPPTTGRSMVLITPDGERTMNTFLGAASSLDSSHIRDDVVAAAAITYVEGYALDMAGAAEALESAARIAHREHNRFAISLSDSFCVERHRQFFLDLLDGSVDICFGNEEEVRALFETSSLDEALSELDKRCDIGAITMGPRGSVIVSGGKRVDVDVVPTNLVDTTGAGDFYAAGVLAGLAQGWDLEDCGHMGSRAASAIVGQMGARLSRPILPPSR